MSMIAVRSSAIRAIGYSGNTLFVQFRSSNTIYCHRGVPITLYWAFLRAESLGRFYARHIRGRF
jgi:hypothetical protein